MSKLYYLRTPAYVLTIPQRLVLLLAVLLLPFAPLQAAPNAYAELKLNGTDLTGFTSVGSIGGVDVSSGHIECYGVNHEIFRATSTSSSMTHTPFKLVKRVDKASPLLYKALGQNESVTGKIKYFYTNPDEGTMELLFTIEFAQARITGIRHWTPNNLDPAAAPYPQMEEVSISYGRITFRDEVSSQEYEMSLSPQ